MTATENNLPKLSAKHVVFAEAFLTNGFKRDEAAQDAGYSAKRLKQTASDILKRSDVKAYIAARMRELQMSADEALLRLGGHAAGNVAEFIGLTIDELKAHPRAALIKRVKFVTYFPEKDFPKSLADELAQAKPESTEDEPVDGEATEATVEPLLKPIQYVESIELYDAQAAMRDVIKQSQLANGLATDNVNMPQLAELIELLTAAGKDPGSVISRMVDKLRLEAGKA